jgi:hypothetical protein
LLDFGFISLNKRKIQTFVVGGILNRFKLCVTIEIVILVLLSARAYFMDDSNFGSKTAPYPEQGSIWTVEYLSNNTAKLIVINIGQGELTIHKVQVNGKNATFEPITLQKHSNNEDFKVTLQNQTFVPDNIYEFAVTTTKGTCIIYKDIYNQTP